MRETIRRIEKPWGFELIFAHTDRYVGKVLHVNPHQALSLQYHRVKDETLYLAEGSVELWVEEEGTMVQTTLSGGESYRIQPHTKHRMVAGDAGCDIIEVSTPELDDVVRLEDRYGRT